MTRYICITGGKGGVGKTTTAVNLACSFGKMGSNCVLVDANISTPNVHHHLGHEGVTNCINDAINGNIHILDAVYKHHTGLKIVPALTELHHLKFPDYNAFRDVLMDLEGAGDIVVLDSAAGLGHEAIVPMEVADEIIVVTSPDHYSVHHAKKTLEVAEELGKTVLGIVLNNVRKDKLESSVEEVEAELKSPVLAVIPNDKKVRVAWSKKHPVVHSHPKSKASKEFYRLAELLLGKRYARKIRDDHKKSLEEYMLRRLNLD